MNFTNTSTKDLKVLWKNLKKGLDKVSESLDDGTFHNVGPKGEASPAQSGQMTLWFAMAVDTELTKRKIKH